MAMQADSDAVFQAICELLAPHNPNKIEITPETNFMLDLEVDSVLAMDIIMNLEDRFEIVTAVDGLSCIEIAEESQPDLILMDISLPVIDGLKATQKIKAIEALRHIPVIAVTAHAMRGDRERILDSGCDDYLSKPIDEDILFAKLQQFLGEPTPGS